MKKIFNLLVFCLVLLASCKKEEPEPVVPSGTPTVRIMTPMEDSIQGIWYYEKQEYQNYGYPPFYPHDTLLSTIPIQTYSDPTCKLDFGSTLSASQPQYYVGVNGMLCTNMEMTWKETTSNGICCIQISGSYYRPVLMNDTVLVLRYPGNQAGQSSYTYHYFHR